MENAENYLKLYDLSIEEIVDKAFKITKKTFKRNVEFCSIISAKTGACSEDCKYCSQSTYNNAKIDAQPLMDADEVEKAALIAKQNGASSFGIVTSGKKPTKEEFEKILEMVKKVSSIENLKCCCCAGILDEQQMIALKNAGCTRYNHNINTSEEYYDKICTTHTFQQRIDTILLAKRCGLEVCAGVIIGMGESRQDRINMALTLKKLKPQSVPINLLDPIKGTALENCKNEIDPDEIIKTICIFRMIMPRTVLRFAGGRMLLGEEYQKLGIMAGINSILTGDYLTTPGSNFEKDIKMLEPIGFHKI